MTPENFCYWLKGYFELLEPKVENEKLMNGYGGGIDYYHLSGAQVKVIQDHLGYVFAPTITATQLPSPYQDTTFDPKGAIC